MSLRAILIPPAVDPAGRSQEIRLDITLVDAAGQPLLGLRTLSGDPVTGRIEVRVSHSEATVQLTPQDEIAPASWYRIVATVGRTITPYQVQIPASVTALTWTELVALAGVSVTPGAAPIYDPAGTAAAAVTAHEALPDPHPGYLTPAEGDAAYDVLGAAAAVAGDLASHTGNTANPHAVTAAQAGADPAGTAAAAVAAHAALPDPHPGYLTPAEGDAAYKSRWPVNEMAAPGTFGAGLGICPDPWGFTPLSGYDDPLAPNFGNYLHTSDGSVMLWWPAGYYRIGHASNPTHPVYGLNSVHIVPLSAFANTAAANAAGYALHRAFYDAGAEQLGFWRDKYKCSHNGAGVASSIRNGLPLSSNAAHNPWSVLTGAPDLNYSGAFAAAKTRGARFFPSTAFQQAWVALVSLAHAQASTSQAVCAWLDLSGVTNYPKGCDNNALGSINDTLVKWVSDGYSNCGKAGSASPFERATHNGQLCGEADCAGLMWAVSPGITCVARDVTVTGVTLGNPLRITVPGHGFTTGNLCQPMSLGGTTQVNDRIYTLTVVDASTISLDGCDGTAFGAWTSGGTVRSGTFYALNTSFAAKNLTGGATLATDQWGTTGVANHSSPIMPTFRTDHGQNEHSKRYGRGTDQVLSAAVSGDGWGLTGVGVPLSTGISDGTSGSNLFGADYLYQYIRDQLCLLSGATWLLGSAAGVSAAFWSSARANSSDSVGVRAASYL